MPTNISPSESEGIKWMKLQLWVRQACENAGITAGGDDPLLSNISQADSEGVKWAKLQRWVALLAENISGGGGGGGGASNSFQTIHWVGGDDESIPGYDQAIVTASHNHFVVMTSSGFFNTSRTFSVSGTHAVGDTITIISNAAGAIPSSGLAVAWPSASIPVWVWDGSAWVQVENYFQLSAGQILTMPNPAFSDTGVLALDGNSGDDGRVSYSPLNWVVTLTENITSITLANMPYGAKATLTFIQDGTGGRTVDFPNDWTYAGGVKPVINPLPGSLTVVDLIFTDFWPALPHATARNPLHRTGLVEVTATRDIAASDADCYLYSTAAGAVALTLNTGVLPIGAEVDVFQEGAGQVSFIAGDGVTIVSKDGNLKLSATGSGATLKHVHSETYHLVGDLTGGSGARGLYSGLMSETVPTQSSTGLTTWVNQGGATVTDASVGIQIINPTTGSDDNIRGLVRPVPATPYTLTALLELASVAGNYPTALLGWADSGSTKTHAVAICGDGRSGLISPNGYSSFGLGGTPAFTRDGQRVWLRFSDDGTAIAVHWSISGVYWHTLYSGAKASSHLGAAGYNRLFFGASSHSITGVATLLSWSID